MKRILRCTKIIFLVAVCLTGPAMADSKYPALRDSVDPELQKAFDTEIYRKSGTWKNFHADGGVVVHRKNEYIIVGIVEHAEGGEALSELVRLVDDLMDKMQ